MTLLKQDSVRLSHSIIVLELSLPQQLQASGMLLTSAWDMWSCDGP